MLGHRKPEYEGYAEDYDQFLSWFSEGPADARVTSYRRRPAGSVSGVKPKANETWGRVGS